MDDWKRWRLAGGAIFQSCVSANVKWSGKNLDSDRPTKTGTARSKQCKKRRRWMEQGWHLINGRAAAIMWGG